MDKTKVEEASMNLVDALDACLQSRISILTRHFSDRLQAIEDKLSKVFHIIDVDDTNKNVIQRIRERVQLRADSLRANWDSGKEAYYKVIDIIDEELAK